MCACAFGRYEDGQCVFLTPERKCSKYDEIVKAEADSKYPMMGSGCSSSLWNDVRREKIMGMGIQAVLDEQARMVEFGNRLQEKSKC